MCKKLMALFLISVFMLTVFTGCGGSSDSGANSSPDTNTETTDNSKESNGGDAAASGDKTKVLFWHSVGGRNAEALDKMISDFNGSQDKYFVEGQYQGTYDEGIQKLRSTEKGQGPDIMQLYDIGTRWMIDSGYSLKMQDFIDKDNFDMSDYESNILAYYTLNDELYSMPFNCSSPVILYNKEAVEKAGLDPKTAFITIDEAMKSAEILAEKGGVDIGGCIPDYSWVFEQFISMQDKDFLDNGNGRTDRATKVAIDENGSGLELLKKWKTFSSQSYTDTYGKGTAESKNQFASGSIGFIIDSCSIYQDISAAAEGSFTVGFAAMPFVNSGDKGGNSVGGGSLWIMDNADDARAQGAWEFIKFATLPEQQANWAIGTGYMPIRSSASDLDSYKNYVETVNPELNIALETLRASKPSCAGGVMGVFPKARVIIENEIETMVNDESVTPEETLENIVSQINEEIETYNDTN